MKFKLFLFFILFLPSIINAQEINVSLPKEASKTYSFVLHKGIKQDTIQKGTISLSGDLELVIPVSKKDYVGMGSLVISGNPAINFIINKENFTLTINPDNKYEFKNSKENTYLYSIIQDRVAPPQDTTLYAYRFIKLISYMQQLDKISSQQVTLDEKFRIRQFGLEKLNIDHLYTSSLWIYIIDGLVKTAPTQETLGNDMVRLLKRIDNQDIFEHLSDNLITITEQFGWDDAFDIIVPYIKESGRIESPNGNMFYAFALSKIRKGIIPPPIEGLKTPLIDSDAIKTLIVFYQPDCDNCHTQMDLLIKEYPRLKANKIRVISISSDSNKESFEKDMKRYPWKDDDKLCDFRGFGGKNFINYGIMSTPIFILLDENKKVIKRYALVSEIDFSLD